MKLNIKLVQQGHADTKTHGNELIVSGRVKVNDEVIKDPNFDSGIWDNITISQA